MPMRSDRRPADMRADIALCRASLRTGSRSFYLASLLLPRAVRDPASALYAFCRQADDAVDVGGQRGAMDRLRRRLALAYAGRPVAIPADRALADVVARFGIPYALPDAMLEGFAWDAEGRRYQDLSSLKSYAARVAGSVGAMMAVLMDARSPEQLARACDLGVAMQLSNIARDVGEDALAGRIYLPLDWMHEAGIDPAAWLLRPVADAALAGVVARLLREADALYASAAEGVADLPLACRPGIGAARLLYAEIGRQVARQGHDPVSMRAVVPHARKLTLLARSVAASALPVRALRLPVMPEVAYLVEAVCRQPAPSRPAQEGTLVWLLALFARLEQRHSGRPIDGGVARAL